MDGWVDEWVDGKKREMEKEREIVEERKLMEN